MSQRGILFVINIISETILKYVKCDTILIVLDILSKINAFQYALQG